MDITAIDFLAFLMIEGGMTSARPIIARLDASRSDYFTGNGHKSPVAARQPRLAQLARAPDCRLETHGCGQPSGGPRFKSGSADQHVNILGLNASRLPVWKIQAPLLANLATRVERDHYFHFLIKYYE